MRRLLPAVPPGPARAEFERLMTRFAAGLRVGGAVAGGVGAYLGLAAPASPAVVNLAVAGLCGWAACYTALTLRRGWTRWVVAGDAVVAAVLCLGYGRLVPAAALPGWSTWLAAVASSAVIVVQVSPWPVLGVAGTLAVAAAYAAGPVLAGQTVPGLAGLLVAQGTATGVLMWMMRRGVRAADTAIAQQERLQRDAAVRASQRAEEREHCRLLHDSASATLTVVAAGAVADSPTLRAQTRRDLDVIERIQAPAGEPAGPAGEPAGNGAADAGRADLRSWLAPVVSAQPALIVDMAVADVVVPAGVGAAVAAAVAEALRNVQRHAAADRVSLRAWPAHGVLRVELADDGSGFDPTQVPAHRRGLRESVVARMSRVGGSAAITSRPGTGTRVELQWPAAPPGPPAAGDAGSRPDGTANGAAGDAARDRAEGPTGDQTGGAANGAAGGAAGSSAGDRAGGPAGDLAGGAAGGWGGDGAGGVAGDPTGGAANGAAGGAAGDGAGGVAGGRPGDPGGGVAGDPVAEPAGPGGGVEVGPGEFGELVASRYQRTFEVAVVSILAIRHVANAGLIGGHRSAYRSLGVELVAWTLMAGVGVVGSVRLLRHRTGAVVSWLLAAAALGMSAVATAAVADGRELTTAHWALGAAGWFGVIVLLRRPIAELVALIVANCGLTLIVLLRDGAVERVSLARLLMATYALAALQIGLALVVGALDGTARRAAAAAETQATVRRRVQVAEALHRSRLDRYRTVRRSVVPLLVGLASGELDPADPGTQRRCAVEGSRLRRLFAETDDVPDPLLHELRACADIAYSRGVLVDLQVIGRLPVLSRPVRRALTEAPLHALAGARRQARVTVFGRSTEVAVSVLTDAGAGEPAELPAPLDQARTVTVQESIVPQDGENRRWIEARWRG